MKNFKFAIIFVFLLYGCKKTFKLSDDELQYIPYEGNEILIFISQQNETDTIFLKGIKNIQGYIEPFSLFPNTCEGKYLSSEYTRIGVNQKGNNKMLELMPYPDGGTRIRINISMIDAHFYTHYNIETSQFDSIPNSSLRIENKLYEDVKIFYAMDTYSERKNHVEKIYWSVKEGFIGLDKKDKQWRLLKKYNP